MIREQHPPFHKSTKALPTFVAISALIGLTVSICSLHSTYSECRLRNYHTPLCHFRFLRWTQTDSVGGIVVSGPRLLGSINNVANFEDELSLYRGKSIVVHPIWIGSVTDWASINDAAMVAMALETAKHEIPVLLVPYWSYEAMPLFSDYVLTPLSWIHIDSSSLNVTYTEKWDPLEVALWAQELDAELDHKRRN